MSSPLFANNRVFSRTSHIILTPSFVKCENFPIKIFIDFARGNFLARLALAIFIAMKSF